MAKAIVVTHAGKTSEFGFTKVDRSKLYGKRRRLPLDKDGQMCTRADLTRDGLFLLRSGMTAQAYFDEQGHWVQRKELTGLDADGQPVLPVPSTLGVAQELTGPVDPAEVLNLQTESVYMLEPVQVDPDLQAALVKGDVFRFPYSYSNGFEASNGYLIGNAKGLFAIIGTLAKPEWCELAQVAVETAQEEENADDLDFEMF